MSRSEVERFVANVKTNPVLRAAIKGKVADPASLVAVARAQGYYFTVDDVRAHVRAHKRDLTDEELDGFVGDVAGMMGMGGMTGIGGMSGSSKTRR